MFGLSQPNSCPLQKLNLRLNNTIGNKGVANLCSAYLKTKGLSNKLLELNLAACHIGQFGSMMIALMLNENPALQILDLSNNHIGEVSFIFHDFQNIVDYKIMPHFKYVHLQEENLFK